jgi:hypothetical protein
MSVFSRVRHAINGTLKRILFTFSVGALSVMPLRIQANVLGNSPFVIDGLIIIEGSQDLRAGAEAVNICPTANGLGVQLIDNAATGSITLAPIETEFPFNQAIPSWNGCSPADAGFRIMMRVARNGDWMPWFEAGSWGTMDKESRTRISRLPGGKYEYDTLMLDQPARQVQFRVNLCRSDIKTQSPVIRLLALSYTNSLGDKALWQRFGDKRPMLSTALSQLQTTQTLSVPFRSQVVPRREWIGRICSPASVCMALQYFGVDAPTQEIAGMMYDPVSNMFGIWTRAIQSAAQEGIRGYIRRFRNWDDVRAHVEKGSVICASIRFERGELREPPFIYRARGTDGHLIVIKGFAPGGRIVVNDSASKDFGQNNLWRQDDLAMAWFDKGGVAYVFTGRILENPSGD